MLAILWPLYFIAFIPIVLIEAFPLRKQLNLSFKHALLTTTVSNIVSTLFGVPLVWLILVTIQMLTPGGTGTYPELSTFSRYVMGVTLQAPWLIPYESQFYWMVPTAVMVLLIPMFFMSYFCEYIISLMLLNRKSDNFDPENIQHGVWIGNIRSYLFLIMLVATYLIYGILTKSA